MAEERVARGAGAGPLPATRADVFVLNLSPEYVKEELEAFKQKLEAAPLPPELSDFLGKLREVVSSLSELSSLVLNQFTTHGAMSVPPVAIARAYTTYLTTTALELRDVLKRTSEAVRRKCAPGVWARMTAEERAKLVNEVLSVVGLTKVTLVVMLYSAQFLSNVVSRAVPNLALRSAPTVEPLGRGILRR